MALDARSARWHWGHGIGTYTAGLLWALPGKYLGHRLVPKGLGRRAMTGSLYDDMLHEQNRRSPPSSDWFWKRVSVPPAPTGDEVLWHNPHSGIGIPRNCECPLVITVHDLIPLVMPEAARPGFLAMFEEQVPRAVMRADRLIVPSEQTKGDLVRLLGADPRLITVTGEAPPPNFRHVPRHEARAHVSARHGLTDPYVLYVGGFGARKNVQGLIQAFARAKPELGPERKLAIAGSPGATQGQVLEIAHRLGCEHDIVWLGYVGQADMPYLYSGADVFVYPSLYEGFGLPPLEAMACGCPVVSSGAASLPEVCGPAALLVDAKDPGALASAIAEAVLDRELSSAMTERGLEQAARFTWPEVAGRTLAVYEEALEEGNDMRRDR